MVPADTPWVFLAVGASDRGVPRWALIDRPLTEEPSVEGTLERVATSLAHRLAAQAVDLPFDERAAALLNGALRAAGRQQLTLLPNRKRGASAEMGRILKRYSAAASKKGDRRRRRLADDILALLDDARNLVDLDVLAEWWLALIRPEWYAHLTQPTIRRPARLRHLGRRLQEW